MGESEKQVKGFFCGNSSAVVAGLVTVGHLVGNIIYIGSSRVVGLGPPAPIFEKIYNRLYVIKKGERRVNK